MWWADLPARPSWWRATSVYEALALQLGMGAAAGVLANVGQGAVGLVIALVLMALLKGSKALDKLAVQW